MTFSLILEHFPPKYRFCCCLHVRTGTLLFALWQIMIHFVLLTILTAALGRSSHFREEIEYAALSLSVMSFIQWEKFAKFTVVVPVGSTNHIEEEVRNNISIHTNHEEVLNAPRKYQNALHRASRFFINAGEEYVAIAITLFSLLFSIMMLVGVINVKPFYLLPYCCLQFIDLFITSLSVISFYTYLPEANGHLRSKTWISALLVILGFLLICLKAYFLSMVWLCYKFLTRTVAGMERSSGFSISTNSWCCIRKLLNTISPCQLISDERPADYYNGSRRVGNRSGANSDPPTGDGQLFTATRNRQSRLVTASPVQPISPEHLCMPPKYEDVLALPVGAFDPPPYWALNCGRLSSSTTNHTTNTTMTTTASTGDVTQSTAAIQDGSTRENQEVEGAHGVSVRAEPAVDQTIDRHVPASRHFSST